MTDDIQKHGDCWVSGWDRRQAGDAVFGPTPIDGYEIDPAIIKVGQQYFDMKMPNLTAIAQDGRWGLAHSQKRYTGGRGCLPTAVYPLAPDYPRVFPGHS